MAHHLPPRRRRHHVNMEKNISRNVFEECFVPAVAATAGHSEQIDSQFFFVERERKKLFFATQTLSFVLGQAARHGLACFLSLKVFLTNKISF